MKESLRNFTFRYLADNEPYGWLERKCAKIAEGAPLSFFWRTGNFYLLSPSAFWEWVAAKPERQETVDMARRKRAERQLLQKEEDKASRASARRIVKLYMAIEKVNAEEWQAVGRLLRVKLRPRPGDIEETTPPSCEPI